MDQFLKSGRFAQICGTTKETLRHYHDVGLLQPVYISDNGYKHYAFTQITDFMLIASMQSAGCSLKEIKDYLSTPSKAEMQGMLEERIAAIKQERETLASRQHLLENTLSRINLLESWAGEEVYRIEKCSEEYFIETKIPFGQGKDEEIIDPLTEHMEYCLNRGYVEEFQQMYRVEEDKVLSGKYGEGFFLCSRVPEKVESPRLRVKQKGTYFKYLRRMKMTPEILADESRNIVFETYDDVKRHVDEGGYRIAGDLYEKEVSVYAGDMSEVFYSEISVLVQEG